jgi:aminomethyltransferase
MPIEYPGGGVIAEHSSVRESVGLFDVSHLGKATVRGPGAAAYVNATMTNDLDKITPGQAQYTMCCDDPTGGVVDDLIVYLRAEDDVLLVPNAANTAEVVRRLAAQAPDGIAVDDAHEAYGVLAVQGPRSVEVVDRLGLPTEHPYMSFEDATFAGSPVVVCRSGYTGEKGFELVPRWDAAGELWDAVLDAGADLGIRPCGLAARDTLRTEMGYPLHGNELSLEITPVQARAGWAVGWPKPAFWGREALLAEKAAGPSRVLRGLVGLERAIPRPGMRVLDPSDRQLGVITSGTFSPTRRVGIALALLEPGVADGTELLVDVRGRAARFEVTKPPFVTPSTT